MGSHGGVRAEVLVSLAIIMVTATALLSAFLLWAHTEQLSRLGPLVARGLIEQARSPRFALGALSDGVDWWSVSGSGRVAERSVGAGLIDPELRALAEEARAGGVSVLRTGAPWDPIELALPVASAEPGTVAVGRMHPVVSRGALIGLLLIDSLVFVAFGGYLLRRRVVAPLLELVGAARSIGEGGAWSRVRGEGVREVRDLARTFNEMSEALEQRTGALEKAVGELRRTNANLSRARAGLDRAERLAAVGSLAAGVAHEVGNPMSALLAFLQLAERDAAVSPETRGHLARAAEQGERVRDILRQLLDFSRSPRARHGAVDLEPVLDRVVSLVHAQKRYEAVRFEREREEGVGVVHSDEGLLSQILLNLVVNAADAAADREPPRIRLSLRPAHFRVRSGEAGDAAREGRPWDAVECEVADNGPGVAEADRERIFDPFFTTKPPGAGTGLGLANAQRFAEQLGGELVYAESDSLGGASFTLRLPLSPGEAGSDDGRSARAVERRAVVRRDDGSA
jgi:signal transduction histidine kinase